MSNKVFELIRDNKKVEIYKDIDYMCPCQDWDMTTRFLFGYSDSRTDCLSDFCNYEDFTKEARDCTILEAIRELVLKHVSGTQIFNFCKQEGLIEYNSSSKFWESENGDEYTKKEIIEKTWGEEPFYCAELSDLVSLLNKYGKDIVIREFSSSGYCQGDYLKGIMYTTKERFEKINGKLKNWKQVAKDQMQGELKTMKRWFWGDVYGFRKFDKIQVVKSYPQIPDREDETCYEWEETDSCWGFFEEPEEIAEQVLSGAI